MQVKLFARLRELAGADLLQVSLPDGTSVGELCSLLKSLYPAWVDLLQRSAIAVNDDYAGPERILSATDDIALIPPVSGG